MIIERETAFAIESGGCTISSADATVMRRLAAGFLALLVLMTVGFSEAAEDGPQSVDFDFSPHGVIRWQRGHHPALIVHPLRGDGWITISRRYTGGSAAATALRRANPGLRSPMRDRPIQVPIEIMRGDLRLEAVRRLFPLDKRIDAGWQHWILDPFGTGEESWEWLSELFSGREDRVRDLKLANPDRASQGLKRGRTVIVPESVLLPVFRSLTPVATPTPIATAMSVPRPTPLPPSLTPTAVVPLDYGSDEAGDYAVYRLRKGEALYSAVVVRFTGQLLAKQVNETAMEIAERSGIDDVTDIPVGYPVKIPLDLLLPDYLPADNPRRLAWVEGQRELGRFFEVVHATDLSGVQVILDAGHGGNDTGALVGGLWESAYAYDIMCRIKANLERHTRAKVWTTIE
ncbi:MAG: N-acetylmuramoyl-L-alanine amidase, partial [Thermoanaerobaculales bacterium]|nr:N-acetylmuramoyl-L-alanine amidase [Thermoanaerobaculales bacterium]